MRQSPIRISGSYRVSVGERAALAKAERSYGAVQPTPDELGGYFDFADWRGKPVSRDNFLGRWTLLYFGYSRCRGSCRTVAPVMAQAAAQLRPEIPAQAMFVDIETQPTPPIMVAIAERNHRHASNWPMRFAMAQLYLDFDDNLQVLTGSRAQLARAAAAYHVLREHVPSRVGEGAMGINHSSMLYLVGPDTLVAAYGYHDASASELVALVSRLAAAEREPVDLGAARQRYIEGACGKPTSA